MRKRCEMIYKNLLFDLDGTVMDSGEGIMESAQYALDHFGFKNEPTDTLRKFVGPSLFYSFTHLYGLGDEDAKKAVQLYRNVYESGNKFHATPYDGIEDALRELKDMGYDIILVTSKPHIFAKQILEHFDLAKYFSNVVGPEMADSSSDKARLINKAINEMNLSKELTIMIGDTRFDIEGALDSGIDSIGVTYGYGPKEDLGKATYIVDSVQELKNMFSFR